MTPGSLLSAAILLLGAAGTACGQFDLEDSHSDASLRGIDSVGPGVAWASGANGTIRRTEDGGYLWQTCVTPKGADKLDFRAVQGFDAKTALVMSSGKGSLSKIFKTNDGCATWRQVFENPDEEGFFDSMRRVTSRQMYLLGDPVDGKFAMFFSPDQGEHWYLADDPGREAAKDTGAFAASNSALTFSGSELLFGTGASPTGAAPRVYRTQPKCPQLPGDKPGGGNKQVAAPKENSSPSDGTCPLAWVAEPVPLASGGASMGVFSLAIRTDADGAGKLTRKVVAVGGDYSKPDEGQLTAAYSLDDGEHWLAAKTLPGGYRSAVAFAPAAGRWITVGPNGSDESADDGRNWTKLQPGPGEAPGVDKGWNALSLPFVVGAKGRIGKLREGALTK